jgi:acetylxylan esterase
MKYHLDYFDKWGNEVADWIVEKSRAAAGISENGGSSTPGNASSGNTTSGASEMLRKGISHPISNVFLLLVALFGI